jgi:hypothetical protein
MGESSLGSQFSFSCKESSVKSSGFVILSNMVQIIKVHVGFSVGLNKLIAFYHVVDHLDEEQDVVYEDQSVRRFSRFVPK